MMMQEKKQIIAKAESYVREKLGDEHTGHDYWHCARVRDMALRIAEKEGADTFIVELAALLHDVRDPKLYGNDDLAAKDAFEKIVRDLDLDETTREHVSHIAENLSFSKSLGKNKAAKTKEFMVVQDADRLDAIGAIGIARAFAYGGSRKRSMHDPSLPPQKLETSEQYKNSNGTSLNHFYEKLLLLKDMMNTETARKIALGRHDFMQNFLEEFHLEWEGKR